MAFLPSLEFPFCDSPDAGGFFLSLPQSAVLFLFTFKESARGRASLADMCGVRQPLYQVMGDVTPYSCPRRRTCWASTFLRSRFVACVQLSLSGDGTQQNGIVEISNSSLNDVQEAAFLSRNIPSLRLAARQCQPMGGNDSIPLSQWAEASLGAGIPPSQHSDGPTPTMQK